MATYYFDPILGNDSNAGTSSSAPKASVDVFLAAAGATFSDTLLLKRGAVHTLANRNLPSGNSKIQPTRLGAYGEGQINEAIVQNGANIGLNLSQRSNVVIEDIWFRANGFNQPVYISSTSSNVSRDHRISRCKFSDALGDTPGLYVGRENTTNVSAGHLIEDCEFFDNAGSGLTIMGSQNVLVRRCKAYRNGATAVGGGHGIHTQSRHTKVSSDWTLASGTIYSRALSAWEVDVFFCRHPSYARLEKNTSTPTTPSVGQFGVSGTTLYVNTNSNPNGSDMTYVWAVSSGIVYEDCEAWANYFGVAPFQEGHGFSLDDWTSSSTIRRCISRDNQGLGFSINGGDTNLIADSVALRNWMRAVNGGSGINNKVSNCTAIGNNSGAGASTNEIAFSDTSTGCEAKNNVVVGRGAASLYGIYFGNSTGAVATNNAISSTATPTFGVTATGTITSDPKVSASGAPLQGSPLLLAGTPVGWRRDVEGKQRKRVPSIGAYDVATFKAS